MANLAARKPMFRTVIIAAKPGPGNGQQRHAHPPRPQHHRCRSWTCCSLSDQTRSSPITADHCSIGYASWRMIRCRWVGCTGSHLLARADLLKGYRCTIHWEDIEALKERFPGIIISNQLFELDRDRYTCSGGVASMNMTLQLIAREPGGRDIAAHTTELLLCDRIRGAGTTACAIAAEAGHLAAQAQPDGGDHGSQSRRPVGLEELAQLNEVSVRQLERLFHKHLQHAESVLPGVAPCTGATAIAAQRIAGT